jgi:hypothetical protein
MIVPMDEIRVLAARLKKAGRDEAVGFTPGELRLICKFSEVFWNEVNGRKGRAAARKSSGQEWRGNQYM